MSDKLPLVLICEALETQNGTLCRIADALEKLTATRPEAAQPEALTFRTAEDGRLRCEACKGTGYVGEQFCSCMTGQDLKRQQERTGHLEV